MIKKHSLALLLSLGTLSLQAQQFRPSNSQQIYKQLKQLSRVGTVMYLAAHPDDENTRLISYLVHHDHMNTLYLSLTRGDGGQNIIGNEQGPALGLIRSNEMMMARKLDGGGQLFTRFIDFGFSKSPEETFRFWDKQQVVDEIKLAIQQHQPDVIICRFPTTGEGGHGQHTASAIAALEAFKQLEKSKDQDTWKPKRILFNAFKFGNMSTIKPGQFSIDINQFDPLLGESYGELAGRSRSEHKSQGAGTPQSYGTSPEYFELMAGANMTHSLYDGVDTSWSRLGLAKEGKQLQQIISQYKFEAPQESIKALTAFAETLSRIPKEKQSKLLTKKRADLDKLILQCAGIQFEALTTEPETVVEKNIAVKVNAISRYPNTELQVITWNSGKQWTIDQKLTPDEIWTKDSTISFPKNTTISQAYWLDKGNDGARFHYPAPYTNEPLSTPDSHLVFQIKIENRNYKIPVHLSYKKLDPTRGDVIEALRIVKPVSLNPSTDNIVIAANKTNSVSVQLDAFKDIRDGILLLKNERGQELARKEQISIDALQSQLHHLNIPYTTGAHSKRINYELVYAGDTFKQKKNVIQYNHIPNLVYYSPAHSQLIPIQWESKAKRIGYITGAGDKIPETLQSLGFTINTIGEAELANPTLLKNYDAIVCGIRMANTRADLKPSMPALWQYIQEGGTVIMQYNTSMGLEVTNFSPLNIGLSRNRITDETAKVNIDQPNHKLLNYPNKISSQDFEDWVQERGVYFPDKWAPEYETLLSMADPNESTLKSAILHTSYGKGHFIYTPLAFFRQLPAGNTGAIKLFINLLNAGH